MPGRPTFLAYSRARASVLVVGAGWVGCFFFFFFFVCVFFLSRLSYISFSNASSFWRRLDITKILWSRPL